MRRNAARGVHAVCFSELPYHLGLPTIHSGYWDPFFAACADTGTVVAMHIGSSSKMPAASPDAPPSVSATLAFGNAMSSLIDFLMSGLLVRFPTLKLLYAESQIGWIPYALQRVDQVWEDNQGWAQTEAHPRAALDLLLPSVYGCVINDPHGLASLDEVGVDNVTCETDYPHSDSSWPDTKEIVTKLVAGLPDDHVDKIVRGNAIKLLQLDLDLTKATPEAHVELAFGDTRETATHTVLAADFDTCIWGIDAHEAWEALRAGGPVVHPCARRRGGDVYRRGASTRCTDPEVFSSNPTRCTSAPSRVRSRCRSTRPTIRTTGRCSTRCSRRGRWRPVRPT